MRKIHKDNQDEDFSPVMHSWIAETRIIKEIGGEQAPVNQEGYDYTHKVYNKVELKTVYERDWHSNGLLAIIGLKNKKNKCDYIHVHDGVNNRNFMIPHDVVFYEMKNCRDFDKRISDFLVKFRLYNLSSKQLFHSFIHFSPRDSP